MSDVVMVTRPKPNIVTPDEWEQIKKERREYERKHRPCTPRRFTFGLLKKHLWRYTCGVPSFWTERVCRNCGKVEHQSISHL